MTGEQKESLGESINEAVGNVRTAALGNDEIPDVVKVGFGFACNAVRHSPMAVLLLGGKTGAPSSLDFAGQLVHRVFGERAALATRVCGSGGFGRRNDFYPAALAFFPEGKRFLDGLLLVVQAATLDGLAHKSLLVGGEVYFHRFVLGPPVVTVKRPLPCSPDDATLPDHGAQEAIVPR